MLHVSSDPFIFSIRKQRKKISMNLLTKENICLYFLRKKIHKILAIIRVVQNAQIQVIANSE
jgi:hypothetical protein